MKAVVQRCLSASVSVDGQVIGEIKRGITVFLGIAQTDGSKEIEYIAEKIIGLRIFEDENGKSNLSLLDVGGELLIIPNFTIYGDASKGKRPGFSNAAAPEISRKLFDDFFEYAKAVFPNNIAKGQFGADMKVNVLNDGPFTLIIESKQVN